MFSLIINTKHIYDLSPLQFVWYSCCTWDIFIHPTNLPQCFAWRELVTRRGNESISFKRAYAYTIPFYLCTIFLSSIFNGLRHISLALDIYVTKPNYLCMLMGLLAQADNDTYISINIHSNKTIIPLYPRFIGFIFVVDALVKWF